MFRLDAVTQVYDQYTAEDAQVWKTLFERQMKLLPSVASPEYLEGIKKVGFKADEIPNLEKINARLKALTGWEAVAAQGIVAPVDFFPLLANRQFPVTVWLRKMDELDFLAEPDLFHDALGHLPLLSNQVFCDFFERIGHLGMEYLHHPKAVSMLGCLYWYAVEFGLIQPEGGDLKIYGAGVLSSYGEIQSALSEQSEYLPFDAHQILHATYNDSHIQDKYFIIKSFEQLYHSMDEMQQILAQVAAQEQGQQVS